VRAGLRRFAEPAPAHRPDPAADPTGDPAADPTAATAAVGERCELCGDACGPEGTVARPGHGHVADLEERSIRCVCRPCWLLFTRRGAAGGRYQSVPEQFVHVAQPHLTAAQWDALQIPVRIAFLFRHTTGDDGGPPGWAAFYPSPAGATQSLLALDGWADVVAENPLFGEVEPDVEAVLVQRGESGAERSCAVEAFVVPITACYELVARVRMSWKGFDGGDEAREQMAGFFAALRERAGRE
jgi:hypothetical protein